MKTILSLITALLLTGSAFAKDGMKQFYARYRHDHQAQVINLPKILLYFSDNDPEVRKLVRHMKSLKIFEMDGKAADYARAATELEQALTADGYENVMQVAEASERVNIYILQDSRYIRRVLISVADKDELVILQAQTRLSFDHLSELINGYKSGKGPGLRKHS